MSPTYDLLLVLHISIVVLMAAPYYNLVLVSERVRFGRGPVSVSTDGSSGWPICQPRKGVVR